MHCDRGLFTRVLATTLGLVFLIGSIAAGRAEPGNVQAASATSNMPHQDGRRWNLPDAAKYLDDRMDIWFANAKKLRTADGQTVCVSCHTTVPYVLARPTLRRTLHQTDPTAQEQRLLSETLRRVQSYDAHQLFYDHTEMKKTESRGTEAVLNAFVLVSVDLIQSRRSQAKRHPVSIEAAIINPSTIVSKSIESSKFDSKSINPSDVVHRRELGAAVQLAFKRLWETQRSDGAWDWLDFGLEPFETSDGAYFGATLAALAVGSLGDDSSNSTETKSGIARLRGYLKQNYDRQSLFNRIWLLLASTRLNGLMTAVQRTSLIVEIQNRQRDDGGWALESLGTWRWSKSVAPFRPPGTPDASLLSQSDGYATGLIVYTLRKTGIKTDLPSVSRGLRWLQNSQRDVQIGQHHWYAWRAHSLNFDREQNTDKGEPWRRMFMSDSATAFAALALAVSE